MTASAKAPRGVTESLVPRIWTASLANQTTKALLEAILERRFADDRPPSETELAEMLNVNRTTLRSSHSNDLECSAECLGGEP